MEEWKSITMRQKIIHQIEEQIRNSNKHFPKSAQELENAMFNKSSSKEEYMQNVSKIFGFLKDHGSNITPPSTSNLTAMLSTPSNSQQINQGVTSGGQMTVGNNVAQMSHQTQMVGGVGPPNMQTSANGPPGNVMNMGPGSGQMGQVSSMPMQMTSNPSPMTSMSHGMMSQIRQPMNTMGQNEMNWNQASKVKRQDMYMINVNQKHMGMNNMPQMSQQGNMGNMPMSMNDQLPNMGHPNVMQPRVPSPGYSANMQIRSGNPTSVSPAMQANSMNFISPSPTSAGPSPVSVGNRPMAHLGVPSPSASMLNTPGQQQSPSSMDERAYIEKVKELQTKYHDTLKEVAQRFANNDSEKARNVINLIEVLENPQKRATMETLRKCEAVLERIGGIKRQHRDEPRKDNAFVMLAESIKAANKTPDGAHVIKRTFAPTMNTLFSSDDESRLPELNLEDFFGPILPEEFKGVSDVIQGEVARLNQRFKVHREYPDMSGDELILQCHLDDPVLPYIAPVTMVVPPEYPNRPPRFLNNESTLGVTQFFKKINMLLKLKMFHLPDNYSITMLLDAWEMSVRQSCSTDPRIDAILQAEQKLRNTPVSN